MLLGVTGLLEVKETREDAPPEGAAGASATAYNLEGNRSLVTSAQGLKFSSFKIASGATLTVYGESPLDLSVEGDVDIKGTLVLSGAAGGDGAQRARVWPA